MMTFGRFTMEVWFCLLPCLEEERREQTLTHGWKGYIPLAHNNTVQAW